jgi:hypothetical protein
LLKFRKNCSKLSWWMMQAIGSAGAFIHGYQIVRHHILQDSAYHNYRMRTSNPAAMFALKSAKIRQYSVFKICQNSPAFCHSDLLTICQNWPVFSRSTFLDIRLKFLLYMVPCHWVIDFRRFETA